MTKLAFTSCMDPMDSPKQRIWDAIARQQPDHLVLLGDNIYMDYGLSKNPGNGKPAKFSLKEFADAMYERYAAQWGIIRASALYAQTGPSFHGVWDDHDFAWNGGVGDSGSNSTEDESDRETPVSQRKQGISRRLMREFFAALNQRATSYPANPYANGDFQLRESLSVPMYCSGTGTQLVPMDHGVTLFLADARSYRTKRRSPNPTALGDAQLTALRDQLSRGDVVLLASGSTLTRGESLDDYGDYKRILTIAEATQGRLLALTGDVHRRDWREHTLKRPRDKQAARTARRVYEATASGAARDKPFGGTGIFGILDTSVDEIRVRIFDDDAKPMDKRVRRDFWLSH